MLVKNTHDRPVELVLSTRTIQLAPGDETGITADEVRDDAMRDHLQVRTVSIVRPTTEEENDALVRELQGG
jgi:hypothetical protein